MRLRTAFVPLGIGGLCFFFFFFVAAKWTPGDALPWSSSSAIAARMAGGLADLYPSLPALPTVIDEHQHDDALEHSHLTWANPAAHDVLLPALRAKRLREEAPGQLGRAHLVFTTSPARSAAARKANPHALVEGVNSPCLWGSFSMRVACLGKAVKPCKLGETGLFVESFRMDVPAQCAQWDERKAKAPLETHWTVVGDSAAVPQCGEDQVVQARDPHVFTSYVAVVSVFPVLAYFHPGDLVADVQVVARASFIARVLLEAVVRSSRDALSANTFQFIALEWSYAPPAALKLQAWSGLPGRGLSNEAWAWALSAVLASARWESALNPWAMPPTDGWRTLLNAREDIRVTAACKRDSAVAVESAFGQPVVPVPELHSVRCKPGYVTFGSSQRCAELGWGVALPTVAPTRVSSARRGKRVSAILPFRFVAERGVCAASAVVKLQARQRASAVGLSVSPVCSRAVAFDLAEAFCKDAGARLCTLLELVDLEVAAETGCEGDTRRVWTQTRCENGGYVTAPGRASRTILPRCQQPDSEFPPAMARCCADVAAPRCVREQTLFADDVRGSFVCPQLGDRLAGSDVSCQELRWKYNQTVLNDGGKRVCASDRVAAKGICAGLVVASEAKRVCASTGARLCTANELRAGLGRAPPGSTACTWRDVTRAWSSDECVGGGGGPVATRLAVAVDDEVCLAQDDVATAFVICCADEQGRYCV